MKRNNKTLAKIKRGFTLVELVIVIAVIAILAAVLIPTFITVIDSANNSADVQLVANMNSVFVTDIDADSTATAENLRKLLKDNGITNFETKKSDNVIVYNQAKQRFQLVNLSNAEVVSEAEAAVHKAAGTKKNLGKTSLDEEVMSTENQLVVAENPFSFADIFKGYTIVSTGGNSFAEAIYKCQGSTKDSIKEGLMWLCNKSKQKETLVNALKNLVGYVGEYTSSSKPGISGSAAFVIKGDVTGTNKVGKFLIQFSDSNAAKTLVDDTVQKHPDTKKDWANAEKVLISEDITELDLGIFNVGKSMTVILPNTVEKVTIPESAASNLDLSRVFFYGNTELMHESAKPLITKENTEEAILGGARVIDDKTINEIKVAVAEFGDLIHETEFYLNKEGASNINQEHKTAHEDRYYTDIKEALKDAENAALYSGLPREVVLASDYIITEDIEIPAGVTLQIPYYYGNAYYYDNDGKLENSEQMFFTGIGEGAKNRDDGSYHKGDYYFKAQSSIVDDDLKGQSGYTYGDSCKYRLTIQSGTLTICNGGAVQIGAVLSTTDVEKTYQGHVSGYYGEIKMEGNASIVVEEGGTLHAYGYVKGGTVTAKDGGTVYEPLIITDIGLTPGLANSDLLYLLINQKNAPFMGYSVLNIQSKFTVNYGAVIYMRAALSSNSSTTSCNVVFIGNKASKDNNGLINLKEKASIELTYSKTNGNISNLIVGGNDVSNLKGDIGKTIVTINGEADTGALMITDPAYIDTSIALFPIPYNFEYIIKGTFNVHNRFAVLPGATVQVASTGTLNITDDTKFYVADYLYQDAPMSGHKYPTAEQLTSAGYEESGVLIVNGTLNVAASATMGGIVRSTEAGGKVDIKSGAKVSDITLDLGGWGYNSCNLCMYTCNLRIYNGTELVQAEAGTTYTSEGSTSEVSQSITVKYAQAAGDVTEGLLSKPDGYRSAGGIAGNYVLADKTDTITFNTLKFTASVE